MNPDPKVFARHVLWKLSDLQAQVYHNQLLLIEILARQTKTKAEEVQSQWAEQVEQMRADRYHEALDAVGIDPDSGSTQEPKRL